MMSYLILSHSIIQYTNVETSNYDVNPHSHTVSAIYI